MKNVAYILVEVFQFLNKRRYAVLRNYDSLPHASGRDIDIIIERRDFFIIRKSLAGLFFHNGFSIIPQSSIHYKEFNSPSLVRYITNISRQDHLCFHLAIQYF